MIHLLPHKKQAATAPDWPACFREMVTRSLHPWLKGFYQGGVPDPDTPIKDTPLLALDFETTGLSAKTHSIVSIGLVPFTLDRIPVRQSRQWLVKPRMPLEDKSVTIHQITHSDVEWAPDLNRHLEDLLELMTGRLCVVHFRGIERPFLDVAIKARLGEGITFPVIDTMELEARLHRTGKASFWHRFSGKRTSIRLADSRQRYLLPHYGAHEAVTDALATAELLQAQIATHYTPETPVKALWV
ncbi:MAG: 3'-5' exonuclease [Saccharospirillum sp.]